MMGFRRLRLGALLAFVPALISAQNATANVTAASTLFLEETETQFSVNVANNSDDVNIFFTSPAYSWVGVGFGEKMEDSLMLIMYPNAHGDNVTISPRIGSKQSEPSFSSSISIDILPGTTINDSMLILNARCRNCRNFLDPKSSAQPMIYAFGPGNRLVSDSPSANLKRHIAYGHFTMDMVTATGLGGVPAKSNAMYGVSIAGEMTRDHDRANHAHAIVGCLALFVLWPLNVIFAGFFKNIKVHVIVSVVMVGFLVVSYTLGGVVSGEYIRSKAFNTPHQILAFVSLFPLLLTAILPLPSLVRILPRLRTLHTPLVSATFLFLVLTGGLGLHLSNQARPIILAYTAISIAVFLFNTLLQSCIRRRGSAYARAHNRQRLEEEEGEDDKVVMLGTMAESRTDSVASLRTPAGYGGVPYGNGYGSAEFGAHGQEQQQQRSPSRTNGLYGGGTMPGPQYMLNMHPGVPVQVNRM
ncbi:CBD9-like protein [Clathrospora elynae]|uniref:CBD9-like protein n=1 Tax=Clathrospora elynae TaxID=706981 RepID=A0A6A5T2C3_9PLEO|nr:CBD9-like protein [Clathrospora elynae]